jgi:hypothetical protein
MRNQVRLVNHQAHNSVIAGYTALGLYMGRQLVGCPYYFQRTVELQLVAARKALSLKSHDVSLHTETDADNYACRQARLHAGVPACSRLKTPTVMY